MEVATQLKEIEMKNILPLASRPQLCSVMEQTHAGHVESASINGSVRGAYAHVASFVLARTDL